MKDLAPLIDIKEYQRATREKLKTENIVIGFSVLYILLQFYFVTLDYHIDFSTHANWGIQFFEGTVWPSSGRTPYKDYHANEYPIISVYGWIIAYGMCLQPANRYWLSVFMLFPYWILAAIGGVILLPLLRQRGINDRHAIYIIAFYFFNPQNIVDTARNHGSLGIFATVLIAYYLWTKRRETSSAVLIALGFGIKIYPILLAPFLFWDADNLQQQMRFGFSLVLALFVIHLPVLPFLPAYFEVLLDGGGRQGGLSLADLISDFSNFLSINSIDLVLLIYLTGLAAVMCILLPLTGLDGLEKFTLGYGTSCLLEPYGGIGHILFVMMLLLVVFSSLKLDLSTWFWIAFICYLILGAIYALPLLGPFKWWPRYYIIALTAGFLIHFCYIVRKKECVHQRFPSSTFPIGLHN